MKNVTIDQLRDILDKKTMFSTHKMDDGTLFFLHNVPGYENNVAFCMHTNECIIEIGAFVLNEEVRNFSVNKCFLFCNQWNSYKIMPKVFVNDANDVVAQVVFDNTNDISADFIARMVELTFIFTCNMFEGLHIFCTSSPDKIVLKDARKQIENIMRDF